MTFPYILERLESLDVRVGNLETWAGPGKAEMLTDGLTQVRAELVKVRRVQARHTRMIDSLTSDVAALKTDVAALKTDVTEIKGTLAEVLRRLPPAPPPAGS